MLLDRPGHRRLLLGASGPAASTRRWSPAAHQGQQVELDLGPGPDADHHDPPPGGQSGQDGGHTGRADQLERDVVGSVVGSRVGLDHLVGAEAGRRRGARAPDRGHHVGAGGMGQLHGGGPHPAGRARDEHPLARRQVRLGEQRVVGGGEHLGKPSGLVPGHAVGHRHGDVLGHHDQLGLAPPPTRAMTRSPSAKRVAPSAEPHHLAGELHAGDVRRPAGRSRVEALRCMRSAPLMPAAATDTSTSPRPGRGSGCSMPLEGPVDDGHRVHRPRVDGTSRRSPIVPAGDSGVPAPTLVGCGQEASGMTTEPRVTTATGGQLERTVASRRRQPAPHPGGSPSARTPSRSIGGLAEGLPRTHRRHGAAPGAGRLGPHLPPQRHGRRAGRRRQAMPRPSMPSTPRCGPGAAVGPVGSHELDGTQRAQTETERIHQSRVAMRRIRSNLRTFRLVFDPGWGTSLRAELAWYGGRLGQSRDLHIIAGIIAEQGPRASSTPTGRSDSSRWSPSGWPRRWPTSPPSAAVPAASSSPNR